MRQDAVRSALMVLAVALGLWALFSVRGGSGAWWGLSALNEHGFFFVGVAVCIAAVWAIGRRV